MTKHIFIISALLLTFVSCTKDDIKKEKKEDLLSISYNKFEFKNFYDLVKNPISVDLLKRRLDAQKITYEPLGSYDKDIFFIVSDTNSVYKNYRIEIQAGDVLINFDNPTSKDIRRDYIQNIIIYPLDSNKNIIKDEQPKEKYKGIFDIVKNSLSEIEPSYDSSFAIVTLGRREKKYDDFINGMTFDDGIAIWKKDIKNSEGKDIPLTLENISKENRLPRVQVDYRPSFLSYQKPLPYGSKYSIQIITALPEDIKKILF